MQTKRTIVTMAFTAVLSFCAMAQNSNRVLPLSGPHNKAELIELLKTSKDPALQGLDQASKNSLAQYFVFENGVANVNGEAMDANIQRIVNSNAEAVFSAILGMPVMVGTYDQKPPVIEISYDEFIKMISQDTLAVDAAGSYCSNCRQPACPGCCCRPEGGTGCTDYLLHHNSKYYHISPATAGANPNALGVYPNPSTGWFTANFESLLPDNYTVKLINSLGQVVYKETLNNFTGTYSKQMDVASFGKGTFILSITNSKSESVVRSIVY